ncbi:MAG: hypothetical protein VW362_05380 [Candidatus Nanopelagicales bacterium]
MGPAIDIIEASEDWSVLGAGHRTVFNARSSDGLIGGYWLSKGIDASFPGKLLPSPAESAYGNSYGGTFANGNLGEWGGFLISNGVAGSFVADSTMITEYVSGSGDWTDRQAVSTNANYSHLFEYTNGGTTWLLAAQGLGATPAVYRISTDGTTWSVSTATNADEFCGFATRAATSGDDVLWGITRLGELRNATNPASGSWSAITQIGRGNAGDSVEYVLGFCTGSDNNLYILTSERLYSFDGTNVVVVFDLGSAYEMTGQTLGNMGELIPGLSGELYAKCREHIILRYDISAGTVSQVWPVPGGEGLSPETFLDKIPEHSMAVSADGLYFLGYESSGGSEWLIKMTDPINGVWHTLVETPTASAFYRGINIVDGQAGPGSVTSAPRGLVTVNQTDDDVVVFDLGIPFDDPAASGNVRFATAEGALYGPWMDFNAQTLRKLLAFGEITASDLSTASENVKLQIELESDQGTLITLINETADASTDGSVVAYTGSASSSLPFTRCRYVLKLTYVSGEPTAIHGVAVHASPNWPRKRTWQMDVLLGVAQRGGGASRYSPQNQETFLFDALQERCTFHARDGATYTVRVLDLAYAGVRRHQGRDHPVIRVSLVEL